MAVASLVLVGLVKLATCIGLVSAGFALRRREATSIYSRTATGAFLAWWWGIAAYMAIQGGTEIAAAFGTSPFAALAVVRLVEVVVDGIAVWGIGTYLLMVFFDSPRVGWGVAAYAGVASLLYLADTLVEPQTASVTAYSVGLAPVSPTWFYAFAYSLFGIPLLVSIVAYGTFQFRVHEPVQRYRATLVSIGLLAWVGGGVLATSSPFGMGTWVAVVALDALAAVAVPAAYHPPASLRLRGAEFRPERPGRKSGATLDRREKHERAQQRLRELI
ncbi:MAG: hypothetical protein ACYDDF_06920 [Thermoplasmatota archaeon]